MKLMIVESPNKVKKIEEMLGASSKRSQVRVLPGVPVNAMSAVKDKESDYVGYVGVEWL